MRKTTRQCAVVVCNRLVDDGVTEDPTIVFEERLAKLAAHREVPPILESLANVTTRSVESFPQRARNIWEKCTTSVETPLKSVLGTVSGVGTGGPGELLAVG